MQDTLTRLGVADVTAVLASLPAAPPDPQSLAYLLHVRNWFRAAAPGFGRLAIVKFTGPTTAQQGMVLERLGQLITPFAIDPERTTIYLPEWSVTALTWTLAILTTAVREVGFTEDLSIHLSPRAAASRG